MRYLTNFNQDLRSPRRVLQELEGFFSDPWFSRRELADKDLFFNSATEIVEHKDYYMVSVDLPGVKKEDIEISFDQGLLTLSGERRLEKKTEGESKTLQTRNYGSFSQQFRLPSAIKSEQIEAKLEHGVLEVKIPKAGNDQGRKILIQGK